MKYSGIDGAKLARVYSNAYVNGDNIEQLQLIINKYINT